MNQRNINLWNDDRTTIAYIYISIFSLRSLQVESALALGATPLQATLQQAKGALVIALSPTIDSAKTMGLVSLPGAMTGLIMAGASPLEAIQVQIVVKNMVMTASTVSSILSSYLCRLAFFNEAFQLNDEIFDD
jgi:putative ABC transport system permease protein